MLVLPIAEDLDELFEDCGLASITALGEPCAVVIVTVDVSFVLVVRILRSKDSRTHTTGEVLNVVFAV